MQYNTQRKQLILPEYGRNVQKMVDYCLTIEDRDRRTACAYAIARIMKNLFSDMINSENGDRQIWDHINVMADFKLDIDFPYEVISKENLNPKPNPVAYNQSPIRMRQYGRIIELMARRVSQMESGAERDKLVRMIANHMKMEMAMTNPEGSEDSKILRDLADFTDGGISIDASSIRLHEYRAPEPQQNTSKKKKKK